MLLGGILISHGNPLEGVSYLNIACKKNLGEACYMLASHYSNKGKRESYMHYLREACDLGWEHACRRKDQETMK